MARNSTKIIAALVLAASLSAGHNAFAFTNNYPGGIVLVADGKVAPGSGNQAVAAAGNQVDVSGPAESRENDDSDLYGREGGFFHPYITLGSEYTDNLFNVAEEETSTFIGRIEPGIWFSFPRTTQIPISITPHNSSPGGLQYQMRDFKGSERFQAYALGGLTYNAYSEESEFNDTDARLEGLFRYNMGIGLSLQVLDRYSYDQDRFEIGSAIKKDIYEYARDRSEEGDYPDENLRRYESNLFMGTADFDITEKIRLKADHFNFVVDYDSKINDYLDRTDNGADFFGYYNYSTKTSFFMQYRFVDVGYDNDRQEDRAARDNRQHYWYGGITWASTEKLAFSLKAGPQKREYDDNELAEENDWDGLALDFQSIYHWTEKTRFTFDLYRKSEESESTVAIDKVTVGSALGYRQNFTERLEGVLEFRYEDSDYNQIPDELERDDNRYYFRPALKYFFSDWLLFELSYSYDKRDSTDDLFDYTTNTVMFDINLAL